MPYAVLPATFPDAAPASSSQSGGPDAVPAPDPATVSAMSSRCPPHPERARTTRNANNPIIVCILSYPAYPDGLEQCSAPVRGQPAAASHPQSAGAARRDGRRAGKRHERCLSKPALPGLGRAIAPRSLGDVTVADWVSGGNCARGQCSAGRAVGIKTVKDLRELVETEGPMKPD